MWLGLAFAVLHLLALNGNAGALSYLGTCSTASFPSSYFVCITSAVRIPQVMAQTLLTMTCLLTYTSQSTKCAFGRRRPPPSAHFYTRRQGPRTTEQRIPEMDESSDCIEPFGHYQGFSALRADEQPMYQFGLHDYDIPEEMISPRMPIPNPVLLRRLPIPRASGLVRSNGGVASSVYRHTMAQHVSGTVTPRPAMNHCPPAHYNSLPPLFTGTYHHNPATGPPPLPRPSHCAPARQGGHGFPPTQLNHNISGTIHVPSVSELDSTSSYDDCAIRPSGQELNNGASQFQGIKPLPLERADDMAPELMDPQSGIGSEAPHDVGSHSSHRLTMSTGSFVSVVGGDLADDVVEVHDVCLLATQRYLDVLRINWSLRHGRERSAPGRAGIIGQRAVSNKILKTKKERAPVSNNHRATRMSTSASYGQRRQRSGGGGSEGCDLDAPEALERLASLDDGTGKQPRPHSDERQRTSSRLGSRHSANNPIPRSTDSLLQNIHRICELIWRRARRDRADVLGAEVQGCRDMQVLQECGETIVLYNRVDFEQDPDGCFARVLEAGKEVCRQLRDWEALRIMEGWEEEQRF